MACLDTSFLIDYLRGNEQARQKYDQLRSSDSEGQLLSASVITAYELEKGAKLSRNPSRDLKIVRELLSELVILEMDLLAVDISSDIFSELSRKGKLVGEFDILIAATCIATNHSLVTNDSDFNSIAKLSKVHY